MEIFWNTIARYNAGTWFYQLVILTVAILLTVLLYRKPDKTVNILMKCFLIFLNSWIAVVYYGIYCAPRDYNMILALFWGIMALVWLYDLCTGYTTFERRYKYDTFALLLFLLPFVYPVFSLMRGLRPPMVTSPVMPYSVAVFTIALLLSFSKRVNMFVVLFMFHWAFTGLSKVYFFDIPEDLLVAGSSVPALYLFFKEYINQNLNKSTKPSAGILHFVLICMCCVIGVFLIITLIHELQILHLL